MRRNFIRILFLGLVLILCSTNVDAQLGGFLKDAAKKGIKKGVEKSIEKKAEKVAEQEMDKQLDKIIETKDNNEQTSNEQNSNGVLGSSNTIGGGDSNGMSPLEAKMMSALGMNANVVYQKQLTFDAEMVMEVESLSPDAEPVKTKYRSYFSSKSNDYAMDFIDPQKNSRGLIIFDAINGVMLMLSDENGNKSGIAMPLGLTDSTLDATKQANEEVEYSDEDLALYTMYKATGRTKRINGFSCKEYVYEDETGSINVWTTRDIKYDYSKAYNYMGGMQALATGGSTMLLGAVLEMNFVDKQTNEKANFYVKEVNFNSINKLDISDYQVMGMGASPTIPAGTEE